MMRRILVVAVMAFGLMTVARVSGAQQVCEPYTQGCTGGQQPVVPQIPQIPQGGPPGQTANPPGQRSAPPVVDVLPSAGLAPTAPTPAGPSNPAPTPPAPAPVVSAGGQTLPVTGGDIAGLTLIAGVLLAGGVAFVVIGKRRTAPTP